MFRYIMLCRSYQIMIIDDVVYTSTCSYLGIYRKHLKE